MTLLYQSLFFDRMGSHSKRKRKLVSQRNLRDMYATGVRLRNTNVGGPASDPVVSRCSKTSPPGSILGSADLDSLPPISNKGLISKNGSNENRKIGTGRSHPPLGVATEVGTARKVVVHVHRDANVSHIRLPLNQRVAPISNHSECSSDNSSTVSGRDELQPLPVITRQLKDRLERSVQVKLSKAPELPMSTVTVIWQAPKRIAGVIVGKIMSEFGSVEAVHMSRRNLHSAQVVYGDIVDACHAVKSRRITVGRHPCIFIEWYHEYLRTRPYASVTLSEDSCCDDSVSSSQQPACPEASLASVSHSSSTRLAPIRETSQSLIPPATANVYTR